MPRAKAAAGAVKKPRGKAAAGHQLADTIPAGEVLRDNIKQEWKLGKPIGQGGFGVIYLADKNGSGPVTDKAEYVLKLEPHANGPLFCELQFYMRVAKPELLEQWKKERKIKNLGVPRYWASGAHEKNGLRYRFMVMERCGTDLQKTFEKNGKRFPDKTVYSLGIKMLNALQYIHSKEYIHADIKASNMLTGFGKKSEEVYLVDYGLAFKYISDGKHKDYKEDPKRVHDGTIEFTSRDAHRGVAPSRRGDLEILGYCMLQWLCGKLPWEDNLDNKDYVKNQKIKHMNNISGLMSKCLPGAKHDELAKYLQCCVDLDYDEDPPYDRCRQLFRQALKRLGGSESDKLVLNMTAATSPVKTPTSPRKQTKAKKHKMSTSDDEEEPSSRYLSSDCDSPAPSRRGRPSGSKGRATPKDVTPAGKAIAGRSTPVKRAGSAGVPKDSPRSKKRVASNGDIIPMPGVIPPALINGHAGDTGTKRTAKSATQSRTKKLVQKSTIATQTSPGLKGLKRSRKK